MKKIAIGVVASFVLLLVGFGIAQASIPAPDGTVNGCYKNSTGDLRVIDSAANCPSGYTALNWNQTGPAGPPAGTGLQVVLADGPEIPPGVQSNATAFCPVGKVMTGGGFAIGADIPRTIVSSRPFFFDAPGGWVVAVRNDSTTETIPAGAVDAWVICIDFIP